MITFYHYLSANPNPATICDECRADVGKVFAEDDDRPTLPRHANCWCYYRRVTSTTVPTTRGIQEALNGPPTA